MPQRIRAVWCGMVDVSARTVLIVDDEELIRLVLVDQFREAGFRVADADSADAAFKILTQPKGALDLLVTDVRMPGATDGLSLASWTRECLPQTKIMIISGYVSLDDVEAANAYDAFLRKPFLPARVLSVAEELLVGA